MADDRGGGEVRGPTSALTSFLRSKNIRVQNANRFRRRDQGEAPSTSAMGAAAAEQQGQQAATASPTASPTPSTSASASPAPRAAGLAARARPLPRRPLGASMSFHEEDDSEEDDGGNEADVSMAMSEGGEENISLAHNRAASTALGQASYRHTAPGSVDFCAMCSKRFTVTAYTKQTPAGGLCHKCGGQSKISKGKDLQNGALGSVETPQPPKKRARRKPNQQPHELRHVPTLQELCINIVAEYIEDVDALIGVGGQNMDMISKNISRNRRLNSSTMLLFLQAGAQHLAFYDCSQIDSEALASIPKFCPNLKTINLQLCGMLDNQALDSWSEHLPLLESVELYGPYLVRVEAWHRFFERVGSRLKSFKIRESPRFDKECCEKLATHCPNVKEIGLAQIGKLNAECLAVIKQYGQQLTYLDISDPGVSAPGVPPQSLNDEEVIDLLKEVGPRLSHLDISRNAALTGRTLIEGVKDNCISLKSLHLTLLHTEETKPEEFVELFDGLRERAAAKLTHLTLERCLAVNDDVVAAVIHFCGKSLEELNINSCDGISEEGMNAIAHGCPNLRKIDVGFCRSVTDSVVMDFATAMPRLKEIWLFSCNKVSPSLTSDRIKLIGKEKYGTN